jgi:hypothetical protein
MILVSLEYDGGMAAVSRDAEGSWLGAARAGHDGDITPRGGTLLDTRPASFGVGDRRTVVGGLLPPGASHAVVEGTRAATGNGAWIALVDALGLGYELVARYEAGDGAIVRPSLPVGWAREPVPDADEPCPACGAATWERVTPTDNSRGSGGPLGSRPRPTAVIVCVRCGHEVGEGTWYGSGGSNPGALRIPWSPLRPVRRWWSLRSLRPGRAKANHKLDFPVYALIGADAEPAGQGSGPDGVHSLTMRQRQAEITTHALRHAPFEAVEESAHALTSVIQNTEPLEWGHGSNAARALRIRAHGRAIAARVARAESFVVDLPVDDAAVRFTGLRDPAGWAAVGETTEVRIVIAASRIDPETLVLRKLPATRAARGASLRRRRPRGRSRRASRTGARGGS